MFFYRFFTEENNKQEIPEEKVEQESYKQFVNDHLDDIWESRSTAIANGSYMRYTSKKR